MNTKIIFGSTLLLSVMAATSALASEQTQQATPAVQGDAAAASPFSTFQVVQTDDNAEQAQVTSVSQLSDVQPTDWAFQALQSLVERYGCIAGYPNGTFRGNRAATRYELAAALNACLDQISDKFATKEDLATVKALQEEFKAELATLKGRVDGLEARTATLEAQQFSTTTKLVGEAIFQGTMFAGNNAPVPKVNLAGTPQAQGSGGRTGDNFTFNYRATLNLLTSFTGKDLLITSLQQGNYTQNLAFDPNATGAFSGLLGPQVAQANGSQNAVSLFNLQYRFPVLKDKGTVYAVALGGELSDFTNTLNPYFDSDGQGALSAFGLRNPIYRQINNYQGSQFTGTGLGFSYDFNEKFNLGVGYLAPSVDARKATGNFSRDGSGSDGGLLGGDYGAIAQLTFKPTKKLGFGLTYVRSYSNNPPVVGFGGITGSIRANSPFGGGIFTSATSANTAGLEFSWEATPRFAISGWAGATFARDEGGVNFAKGSKATILNYALNFAFPDLFMPGNMGGIIIGSEPFVLSHSDNRQEEDMNFHIEALYRMKINENISITPGIVVLLNPEGNSQNDPVILGTLRTTFTF
jgi:Carbohydrate-selective porin, OprB family/S-layer homology domain